MMFSAALITATLLGSATASPILTSSKWKRQALEGLDFELVNLARNLESLELSYWNQGLNNYSASDFANAGYSGFRTYTQLFRDQEIVHFTLLNEAAGGGFKNCSYNTFNATNPYEFIALGQVITSVGEGAFLGALGNLTKGALTQTAGQILGNEARQNSKLREEIGETYFNAVNLDTPLTASQAYSLAKPFLSGCPSSNPPINFKAIPPIMANFTTPSAHHKAGDEIAVMWDADKFYLGQDVHIQFLSDMYSIPAPLNQASANAGMGTVALPNLINGTAFLVATNFGGQGPIPDEYNYGIGYVVVS